MDELYKAIIDELSEISGIEPKLIGKDDNFQDILDIDSLEAVTVIYKIEKRYGVKLKGIDPESVQTPYLLYLSIKEKLG